MNQLVLDYCQMENKLIDTKLTVDELQIKIRTFLIDNAFSFFCQRGIMTNKSRQ